MKFLFLYFLLLFNFELISKYSTINEVVSYKFGSSQTIGQDSIYFPRNIYGFPSKLSSETEPASAPDEILSLGKGGEIIVRIKDSLIKNGVGNDFYIYENPMKNNVTGKIFAEPAIISVSQDGINFIEFQYNSKNLDGLAGKTPTTANGKEYNHEIYGGDGFDLDKVGLDFVKFIKIRDAYFLIDSLDESSQYYHPQFLLSGFDLDAVVVISSEKESSVSELICNEKIIVFGNKLIIDSDIIFDRIEIYDLNGNLLLKNQLNQNQFEINSNLNGFVIIRIFSGTNYKDTKKVLCE